MHTTIADSKAEAILEIRNFFSTFHIETIIYLETKY